VVNERIAAGSKRVLLWENEPPDIGPDWSGQEIFFSTNASPQSVHRGRASGVGASKFLQTRVRIRPLAVAEMLEIFPAIDQQSAAGLKRRCAHRSGRWWLSHRRLRVNSKILTGLFEESGQTRYVIVFLLRRTHALSE